MSTSNEFGVAASGLISISVPTVRAARAARAARTVGPESLTLEIGQQLAQKSEFL